MFQTKYSVSILNSKWEIVKRNVKLLVVPREGELIYLDGKYVNVIKIIHMFNQKQEIFIIIEDLGEQVNNINIIDSQLVNSLDKK